MGGAEFRFSDGFSERFRIDRVLGEGGAGRVWLAHDLELDRPVAIKVLLAANPESEDLKRFLEEARVAASLAHPNILPLLLNGEDQGKPFVIFQFIEGSDLGTVIAERGRLPADEAVRFACGILDGLLAAHAAGVVHRDVKPQNVLVRASDGHPFVADFGLARASGRAGIKTQSGIILGTPLYMSPERVLGHEATPSADVYALACVLYEMLAGQPPLGGLTPYEAIRAHLDQVPRRLDEAVPGVSRHLASVVERGLAKKPGERWSAAEMAQALRSSPAETGRTAVSPSLRQSAGSRAPRDPSSGARAGLTRPVSSPRGSVPRRPALTVAASGAARGARPGPAALAALAAGVLGIVGLAIGLAWRGSPPAARSPTREAWVALQTSSPDDQRARALAARIASLNVTSALLEAVTEVNAPPGAGRPKRAYDKAVSFLDIGKELQMLPGVLPRTAPRPQAVAELVRVLGRDLAPLAPELAWLDAERARLYADGGLPDALQRRLYAAVQQLVWRDLVLRAQHSREKEANHQRLHAPLVVPLEPAYFKEPHAPPGVKLSSMECFLIEVENYNRPMLDAYVSRHSVHEFYKARSAGEFVALFRREPRTKLMPKVPDDLRQGRVELVAHVDMMGPMYHIWVSWPAPEPGEPGGRAGASASERGSRAKPWQDTRLAGEGTTDGRAEDSRRAGEPVVLRLHHPGTREALLRMDGWDEPHWNFDKPEDREPRIATSLMRIGVSFPGRWLPPAGTPVTIGFDGFPGVPVSDAAQYHRATLLHGLAFAPARAR